MKKLFNNAFMALMFTSIALLSTYWSTGHLAGEAKYPWQLQFFVLWISCSIMLFCIDSLFSRKK